MEFDEMKFQDEIELMNMERQVKQNQIEISETFGFNTDELYKMIEKQN
mgnify:CR=1 FL=1